MKYAWVVALCVLALMCMGLVIQNKSIIAVRSTDNVVVWFEGFNENKTRYVTIIGTLEAGEPETYPLGPHVKELTIRFYGPH